MVLRLLIYLGLSVDAAIRGHITIAALCFVIPFAGPTGMLLAVIASVGFLAQGFWIEAVLALGYVAFCLVGNRLISRYSNRFDEMSITDMSEAAESEGIPVQDYVMREVLK